MEKKRLARYLDKLNYTYTAEKKFDNLVCKSYLRFDYYLEFSSPYIYGDGLQHYEPVEFIALKIRDNLISIILFK